MLPPAPVPPPPSVVVGATIVKRFPGYGVHRGTVAEIDGGKVLDGQLVPRAYKRRRAEPAATPSPRARRPRRAVNYNVTEPDDDDDAPMREKLIKWKLSGCTVAVTQVMVPDP